MLTRRGFAARLGIGAAAIRMLPEAAYAQRATLRMENLPSDMVWLNANENPLGPPEVALAAMRETLPTAGRYHFQEFAAIDAAVARSENLQPDQVLTGAGSSEVLHLVVDRSPRPRARSSCPTRPSRVPSRWRAAWAARWSAPACARTTPWT